MSARALSRRAPKQTNPAWLLACLLPQQQQRPATAIVANLDGLGGPPSANAACLTRNQGPLTGAVRWWQNQSAVSKSWLASFLLPVASRSNEKTARFFWFGLVYRPYWYSTFAFQF